MIEATKKLLRQREPDIEKIKSILNSAKSTVIVTKKIPLTEESATVIFRELYEAIRQLGDAKWWLMGYEPNSHEVSLESLTGLDIKEKLKLNYLDRFRRIRNDVNYRGFRATSSQAKEILDFWNACSEDIIKIIEDEIKQKRN